MKRFIQYFLMCCFSVAPSLANGGESINQLIRDFLSTDWPTVLAAKEKIENLGQAGIPDVIAVMNDCRMHELQNTGDLIFPGAEKYLGHGQIIDYDIDDICVRAGWLLEDLTFRNFGFTGIHLPDDELSIFTHAFLTIIMITPANKRPVNIGKKKADPDAQHRKGK
jgi:hypothetical protein